ncbi:hypothetical protein GCM10009610_06820 [Pseudonocardia xinjiangensis]
MRGDYCTEPRPVRQRGTDRRAVPARKTVPETTPPALTRARTCNGMHPDTVPTMGRGRAKQKRDRGAGPDGGSAGVPAPVVPVPPAPSGGGNKPVPDHTSAPEDGSADDREL